MLMTKRIDFMIGGVQKGGTTSLDAYLRQHPDVRMSRKKEPHFFDKRPPTGIRSLDYAIYHRNFDWRAARDGCALGEATPITCWGQGALDRVYTYNPYIRLIILLRDPVERAWSHYRMDARLGRETLPYSEAIRKERERARRALPSQDRERSYLARGYYAPQVRELRRLFDDSQLLFLRSEDLFSQPQSIMSQVCEFLNVVKHQFDTQVQHNADLHTDGMDEQDRKYLRDVYAYDAAETRALLGWDRGPWCV